MTAKCLHAYTMEKDGLLARRRDPDNRRIHIVELPREIA
jgi:DNA-binding MarR family transcriptional regulator